MDLFELRGIVEVDTAAAVKSLDAAGKSGEKLESRLSRAFSAIGKSAAAAAKLGAAAMKTGAAAAAGLATAAVNAYSEHEQLVGGVETLFGESAAAVEDYAERAYKTAGLSANAYMETVTGFAASLLGSLEGDTAAAARVADTAVTDMADNANKMGTDIASIQNAYQGFAKQNYTMLDNLKLGYGGTKKEMERLLRDAEKLTGVEYDISSFSDIVAAIHAVQEEMGITGTTAEEASETIQGSFSAAKAAFEDLLTSLAKGDDATAESAAKLAEAVGTAAENLLPRVEISLGSISRLVTDLAPRIAEAIPRLAESVLPAVSDAAGKLVSAAAAALPEIATSVTDAVPSIITAVTAAADDLLAALPEIAASLLNALPKLLPELISAAASLIYDLAASLEALLTPLVEAAPEIITTVASALMDNLPILIEAAAAIVTAIVRVAPALVLELVRTMPELLEIIGGGIKESAPVLIEAVSSLLVELGGELEAFVNDLLLELGTWLAPLADSVKNAADRAWESIKLAAGKAADSMESLKDRAAEAVSNMADAIKEKLEAVGRALAAPFEAAADVIKSAVDRIKGYFENARLEFPEITLPHFSVRPEGWSIGDLLKGSIPTLSVDWYARAMNDPVVMRRPTVFGASADGSLLAGGEAGEEIVSGASRLKGMIGSAVAAELGESEETLGALRELLERYLPTIAAHSDRAIVVDDGSVIGYYAPLLDSELGRLRTRREKGR